MIFLKKVKDVFMNNFFENLTNSTKKRNWSIVRHFRRISLLKMDVTLACFQVIGTLPFSGEKLKRSIREGYRG